MCSVFCLWIISSRSFSAWACSCAASLVADSSTSFRSSLYDSFLLFSVLYNVTSALYCSFDSDRAVVSEATCAVAAVSFRSSSSFTTPCFRFCFFSVESAAFCWSISDLSCSSSAIAPSRSGCCTSARSARPSPRSRLRRFDSAPLLLSFMPTTDGVVFDGDALREAFGEGALDWLRLVCASSRQSVTASSAARIFASCLTYVPTAS